MKNKLYYINYYYNKDNDRCRATINIINYNLVEFKFECQSLSSC